jgi:5-methylcytosine-specific restriction enzyme A
MTNYSKDYFYLYNTSQWKKTRQIQLQQHPLCKMCADQGLISKADIADHITPHKGNHELFFYGPLQSLCKLHHDSVKQAEEKSGIIRGCNILGEPLDTNHHWNGD